MKKVNLDLIAYKLLVFLFIPISWLLSLICYFVSTEHDKHICLYLAVFLIVCNYFTYIKNRLFYWIGYVLILIPTFLIYASSRIMFGEIYITTFNTQSSIVVKEEVKKPIERTYENFNLEDWLAGGDGYGSKIYPSYRHSLNVTGVGKQFAEEFNKNIGNMIREEDHYKVHRTLEVLLNHYESVRSEYKSWLREQRYSENQQKQIMAEFDSVAIHPYSIKGFLLSLFGSYANFKTFVEILGLVLFLVYFYFWTGVGYLFKSYNNITISGGVSWRMKLSIPDFIKNPIVIGALIISLSGIIMVAYYRYTDPYNHCLREFKKKNTKASDLSAMQRCNKLIYNK